MKREIHTIEDGTGRPPLRVFIADNGNLKMTVGTSYISLNAYERSMFHEVWENLFPHEFEDDDTPELGKLFASGNR